MRIALFSDTYYPQVNGVALTLKRLVRHLEHRRVPYRVFVPKVVDEDLFQSNIHSFSSIPFFLYPECRLALPNYASIRSELHRFRPDLIHMASPFNMGLCGLHYGRKHGVPHVASYHTHFDRYLDYYHLKFAAPLLWRYMRWFHESCLATFAPSRETKAQLLEQGIRSVELWQRGVDCHLFHPGKRSGSVREKYGIEERYILLYVGRFAPEKDIDILAEIMTGLPEPLRTDVHWLLVGSGPLLSDLRQKAPANATFTGYLGGEELAEAYASSDLFVFPSSTETFGNVVLESFASGTPVVGARSGGVQELVQDGTTGWLCPPRDGKAFVQTIASTLQSPDLLHKTGCEARSYALSQSWDAIFDGLLERYEQLTGAPDKSKDQWHSA
ncbi:glycosyltransferase family 1 protein [Paenibacillus mesophilus]|uniref:glycosyltransferase family 4 protein n=1 Tax=Paenibacillus mesophilus TaxID=2582849 RepID=UPI00110E23B0|nr:glycosyltransferase family 1 protein [Paenibacillus mesophilus]TMV46881.1 glycosyltransferase family 1 protein [Paenibacillus mesophilus]